MPKRMKKQNKSIADHPKFDYQTVFKNKTSFGWIFISIFIGYVLKGHFIFECKNCIQTFIIPREISCYAFKMKSIYLRYNLNSVKDFEFYYPVDLLNIFPEYF